MSDSLDDAISLCHDQLQLHPKGDPERADLFDKLAGLHYRRFYQKGDLSDLEEALAQEYHALELCPQGHPDRPRLLGKIAACLYTRYHHLGALSDLEGAISLERCALELRPTGHPSRALSLGNLANSLCTRFQDYGALQDLEEALSLHRCALELHPEGDPQRSTFMANLATCLLTRFSHLGILSDLEEALAMERSALELRPEGHPDRALSLRHLASSLHARFNQLGAVSDLEEALALQRSGLELCPLGHPDRPRLLSSIAMSLNTRFSKLGAISDIEEALALERSALELRSPGHPGRANSLYSIATYLHARFTRLKALPDLEEAISLQRSALELQPPGHPGRTLSLGNLANHLFIRFNLLGALSDLEEAISLERTALELCPKGHPTRSTSLSTLAYYIHIRSKHSATHTVTDLRDTFNLFSQLSDDTQMVSHTDLECAKQWVQTAEECRHSSTVLAYQTFMRLSVQYLATLPSLPQHLELLKQLMKAMSTDAFSACVRYGDLASAVELLEQGRGVFWNQLTRLRSPLTDVTLSGDKGRELADKFSQLITQLRKALDAPPNVQSQHDRVYHLNIQLQDIAADIRKLPGLSRFLLPPLFSDLRVAAAAGPVIIVNASRYSCDALIILSSQDPIHIALQTTKDRIFDMSLRLRSLTQLAKFSDVKTDFVILLRELWEDVVFPIVKVLQTLYPRGSRVWWCPTAEFCLFPFHAAGFYRKDLLNFSDLYISSYTPTLTALVRALQKRRLDLPKEWRHFLLVGQAQALGENELASVNAELCTISERVGPVSTITCIQDQDATILRVAEELNKNNFVHFACHGIPDRTHPFESGFAMGDGLLKVENIMRYELRNAQFAYLSACHTTVGDKESPDESIHLAAAMQFAGFSSVIGTMWAVDDTHTNGVTSKFYAHMIDESGRFDPGRAALALHKTMRSLFARSSKVPFDQRILYVHIGA